MGEWHYRPGKSTLQPQDRERDASLAREEGKEGPFTPHQPDWPLTTALQKEAKQLPFKTNYLRFPDLLLYGNSLADSLQRWSRNM